jgi:uncharacterized protein (DUF1697 family)
MPKTKSPITNENCYVALLRGINVGGNNLIKMTDLRTSFGTIGFTEVQTYIQSGNVVFCAKQMNKARLTEMIEQALSDAFRYQSRVVVISAAELQKVVAQAPKGFGQEPDLYRYDVLFVREPLKTSEALTQVPTNPDVDTAHAGDHALYFRRLIATAPQSYLNKLVQRAVYKHITVRNWRTTTKLLEMVSQAD